MAKSDNQKLKILYILDYLQKNSHEGRPVRAAELISMLDRNHRILCERKTIYSDIAALQEYGIDIVSLPGKNGGYYIASRNFELPELKLLIDAVQSSRYLTEKKSKELIEKLCKECSVHDAALIRRDVLVSGRVKSMNETIYYNVDTIQDAIAENKQIIFRYFDWGLDGKRHYREKKYQASPYGLCQSNENCYLLAYSERHGITSYRVDKMSDIEIIAEKRVMPEEKFNAADYVKPMFSMFDGEITQIKAVFHISYLNVIIDRFGDNVRLSETDNEECFEAVFKAAVSPTFLSWIISFGDGAMILSPRWVAEEVKNLALLSASMYDED